MAKFNPGDVVVLKSGGPKMTVHGYHKGEEKKLTCTWFHNHERVSESFNEDTLDSDK